MTLKVPFKFLNMKDERAPELNRSFSRAYSTRLESFNVRNSATINARTYQSMEHGEVSFSANGSPVTTLTFALAEKHNTIIYAEAHAISTVVVATVTDITNTSITMAMQNMSAGGDISDVTTDTIKVFYQVVGSSP